jgi:hypothetical protein
VILPLISAIGMLGLGAFLSVSDWQSVSSFALNAQNGRFLALVPLSIVALGVLVSAWAKWGRKAPYFESRRTVAVTTVTPLEESAL